MFKNRPTSKFRHMFGKAVKADQCYNGVRMSKNTWEGNFCHVNPKFLAIITEAGSGASFMVIPVEKVGRIDINHPLVGGHNGAVLDVKWNPFDDNTIASASEDCTAMIWYIPDGGLKENLEQPLITLRGHQRKVTHVVWHPSAENILLTAGQDKMMFIWNLAQPDQPVIELSFPDIMNCVAFNYNGSQIAATFKDKMCRVMDARKGELLHEWSPHQGTKPSQCVFMRDGKLFTTGFEKMSERRYALWDLGNLSKPLDVCEIDTSNGVLFPFYDSDIDLIYLSGKGDGIIRYYEQQDASIFYLNLLTTKDGARGLAFMPKRGLDFSTNEIAKVFKLHALRGVCEVISFTVPRVADNFQDDLYPETLSTQPAMTAAEWLIGENRDPLTMSCKSLFDTQSATVSQTSAGQSLKERLQSQISSSLGPSGGGLTDRRPSAGLGGQGDPTVGMRRMSAHRDREDSNITSVRQSAPQIVASTTSSVSSANGNCSSASVESHIAPLRDEIEILRQQQSKSDDTIRKLKSRIKVLEARVEVINAKTSAIELNDDTDDDALV